ncbi:hypothetical protein D1AOALGA4SA_643 [Olavius algarvensis Delta 1 endosymbiont]|nr:hypothetical protein D1AOALGA4SA_643 [Olavius algarvensis Delta 1 endosymbiont]
MKMYSIDIDEKNWHFLQQNAEPFVDTPNSVLRRLLFKEDERREKEKKEAEIKEIESSEEEIGEDTATILAIPGVSIAGLPKALSQILEVVYEIKINGVTRIRATNRVAKRRGTAPGTVTDKYCRQLGQRAHEIDEMFAEPDLNRFKGLLNSKFEAHRGIINMYLDTLMSDADDTDYSEEQTGHAHVIIE